MWTQLTGDDVWNALSQAEVEFFNTQQLENGQADRITRIVSWVASMVRGRIAAYPENNILLPTDESLVPNELYRAAIIICRYDLLTAFPQGRVFLDEPRVAAYRDAMKSMDDVASGKLIIQPGTGAVHPSNVVLYNSRDQGLDWSFWH